jgi:hypothetical protein
VRIDFQHAAGDLDMAAFDGSGTQMTISQSTTNSESVFVPAGGAVKVYGYQGASGAYRLTVE